MSIRGRLRRLFAGLTATVGGEATDDEEIEADATDEPTVDYDPNELERRTDTLHELGLEPAEFVTRLVEEEGGRVRQQAFTEYTNWSEGMISRLLSDLEEENTIVRIEMGREKIVCLPDETPTIDPPDSEDDTDPPSPA